MILNQHLLSPIAVELVAKDLLPRPEIEFAVSDGNHNFATHDLPLQVRSLLAQLEFRIETNRAELVTPGLALILPGAVDERCANVKPTECHNQTGFEICD